MRDAAALDKEAAQIRDQSRSLLWEGLIPKTGQLGFPECGAVNSGKPSCPKRHCSAAQTERSSPADSAGFADSSTFDEEPGFAVQSDTFADGDLA